MITLHSGETRQGFILRMTPLGAISGVVLDQDGDPLDGTMVSLWMPWFQRGKPGFVQRGGAATNDRGEYRITDVVPGRYVVMVNGTGRQAIRIQPESVASVQPIRQAIQIEPESVASVEGPHVRADPVRQLFVAGDLSVVQPIDQRFEPQYGVQYFPATERLSGASLLAVAGKKIEGIDFHMVARSPAAGRSDRAEGHGGGAGSASGHGRGIK